MTRGLVPGDVILVQGQGLVDGLIRFGQRKKYRGWCYAIKNWRKRAVSANDPTSVAHAAVYVGNGFVIEALAKGLCLSPLSKYDPSECLVARLEQVKPRVSDRAREDACNFAREQLKRHDRYGWLSILSIVLQMVTPLRLDVSWDGAIICSAFAAQCWEHAGVILPTASSLTTTPSDLAIMAGYGD